MVDGATRWEDQSFPRLDPSHRVLGLVMYLTVDVVAATVSWIVVLSDAEEETILDVYG